MTQRVTVRERIDPAITASLFANYRSSADAVMELVDNAIDSRLKGSPLEFERVRPPLTGPFPARFQLEVPGLLHLVQVSCCDWTQVPACLTRKPINLPVR
jgi:hypothetical protein